MSEYIKCIKCAKLITMNKTEMCISCRTIDCEKCGRTVKKYTSLHVNKCGSCSSEARRRARRNSVQETTIYL